MGPPWTWTRRVAVVGPLAHDPLAFFGCYSMPRHLGEAHPEAAASVPVTTLRDALRGDRVDVSYAAGGTVRSGRSGERIVEPGEIGIGVGGASDRLPLHGSLTLHGPVRAVGPDRVLVTEALVAAAGGP
jgi:hypothetical protein